MSYPSKFKVRVQGGREYRHKTASDNSEYEEGVRRATVRFTRKHVNPNESDERRRQAMSFTQYAAVDNWFLSPIRERLEEGASVVDLG
jgi:hypothetical protein